MEATRRPSEPPPKSTFGPDMRFRFRGLEVCIAEQFWPVLLFITVGSGHLFIIGLQAPTRWSDKLLELSEIFPWETHSTPWLQAFLLTGDS